jgi:hypothetical protein
MAKTATFEETFRTLRGVLQRFEKELLVQVDEPQDYQLASKTLTDRIGRPLFVAAVQVKKSYVSYHLMPVYAVPALRKGMSPTLKKRMQGKACFNFTTIESEQVKELAALTKAGIAAVKHVKVPWASAKSRSTAH